MALTMVAPTIICVAVAAAVVALLTSPCACVGASCTGSGNIGAGGSGASSTSASNLGINPAVVLPLCHRRHLQEWGTGGSSQTSNPDGGSTSTSSYGSDNIKMLHARLR